MPRGGVARCDRCATPPSLANQGIGPVLLAAMMAYAETHPGAALCADCYRTVTERERRLRGYRPVGR
jgi:tRNA(Met) C34 N-acetyltransferase TmcA